MQGMQEFSPQGLQADVGPYALNERDIQLIEKYGQLKHYPKRSYIYQLGRDINKLYLIRKGKVKIGYCSEEGKEAILNILSHHDVFGNILGERKIFTEFVQTLSEVSLYVINERNFFHLMRTQPACTHKILRLINRRFYHLEQQFLNLILKDVKSRLIEFLKFLATHHGQKSKNYLSVPNFLTHQEIAELNGTSRQTVSSILAELKKKGWIDYNRGEIKIYDQLLAT